MRLVRGVGLQMASQCLLVLNFTLHTGAWVGIGVVAIMEPSMEDEMVFPREKFWAVGAIVFVIVLVSSLCFLRLWLNFEDLSAVAAPVFAVICVAVHVACQGLFHPGCVFTQRTS